MKTLPKLAFALTVSASIAGCSTTSGLAPQVTHSGFDQARVVSIPAHGGACTGAVCPGIGAEWRQASPSAAVFTVKMFNVLTPITSAALSIDGRRIDLLPVGITTFSSMAGKESRRDFAGLVADARLITTAQRVWLQVGTVQGTHEVLILEGSKDSKAYHAMRRFVQAIGDQQADGVR